MKWTWVIGIVAGIIGIVWFGLVISYDPRSVMRERWSQGARILTDAQGNTYLVKQSAGAHYTLTPLPNEEKTADVED